MSDELDWTKDSDGFYESCDAAGNMFDLDSLGTVAGFKLRVYDKDGNVKCYTHHDSIEVAMDLAETLADWKIK